MEALAGRRFLIGDWFPDLHQEGLTVGLAMLVAAGVFLLSSGAAALNQYTERRQ